MNSPHNEVLLPLRESQHANTVRLRDGGELDISQETWRVRNTTQLSELRFYVEPFRRLSPELRVYAAERLACKSTTTCMFTLWIWLHHFRQFLLVNSKPSMDWGDLTIRDFTTYREFLIAKGTEYYFWHVQTVVNWLVWSRPGLIDAGVAKEVTSWTIEGNRKGEAVSLGDPHAGALTRVESQAIRTAATAADCPATLLERVVTLLLLETGARNEQLSKLKVSDFRRVRYETQGDARHYDPEGAQRFSVLLPSNKTANGYKDISISKQLFDLCIAFAASSKTARLEVRGNSFLVIDPAMQPIMKAWFDADTERWSRIRVPNSWDINILAKNLCESCDVSNRFGDPLTIFPRRFRRTIATRLIEQGASPDHVATFLDHADVQQVMVYFEFNEARKQERIEEAAGPFFRALGEAATGKLIADATKARNPDAVIALYDEESQDLLGIANCGRDMQAAPMCHDTIPFACYGCTHHQPWISDIHGKVLANLEKRRQGLKEAQGRNEGRLLDSMDSLIDNVRAVKIAVDQIRIRKSGGKP